MDAYERWEKEYTSGIDITKIKWVKLSLDELKTFYEENYLDRKIWEYVTEENRNMMWANPIGLHYLTINENDAKSNFLLGLCTNSIHKKTIIAAIQYRDEHYLFMDQVIPFTYISTVEVNRYFWHKGIYKEMCNQLVHFIRLNQPVLTSRESAMGAHYRVCSIMEEALRKNGFTESFWIDNNLVYKDTTEMRNQVCTPKTYVKKDINK